MKIGLKSSESFNTFAYFSDDEEICKDEENYYKFIEEPCVHVALEALPPS